MPRRLLPLQPAAAARHGERPGRQDAVLPVPARHADVARLAPVWRQTMQSAAGKTEPWMIAVDEAGQTVIDQAWPATVDDCLRLLRRYGGQ